MRNRYRLALVILAAVIGASCSAPDRADYSARGGAEPEALLGVERNTADGQRRVDTSIDPEELEPPPPPAPSIGNLEIPCRPAESERLPSVVPGVSETSITIGTGSDRGGLHTSGSGRSIPDAVRILADRCNALGGVNGRRVEVDEHDAAVVEVLDRIEAACEQDFALVGQGFLLDSIADPARVACGLPSFPAWTTQPPAAGSLTVLALPSQPEAFAVDGLALAVFTAGEAGRHIGMVVPDTDAGSASAARVQAAVETAGLDTTTSVHHYSITREPRWPDLVAAIRAVGAGVVWFEGACESALVPFMEAAAASGWRPQVVGGPDLYDPYCVAGQAETVDGTIVQIPFHPVSDREEIDAVDEHVQLLRAAGIAPTGDALRAASSFWLFATAASRCGEPLTRQCVLAEASLVDDWTAGGLHPPTDPGTPGGEQCLVLVGAVAGEFERLMPVQPGTMDCGPEPLVVR